ncbi:MAG: LysR family transcriptional regulator, partial [Myxococcales bacterium]
MELHQLQCFIDVVEKGGFRRATARVDMTQPALSYQIKRLEEELGVPLFHRRAGGIAPTEAGRIFLEHAHKVIEQVREAHRAVRELSEATKIELRIGTLPCIGAYFLPQALREIRSRFPTVRPKLTYGDSSALLASLIACELDVALVADPQPDARVQQELVLEDRFSAVSGRGSAFFGRASVAVRELAQARIVLLSAKTSTGALIRRFLEGEGVTATPVLTTDDPESIKMLVEEGMGITILPDMATEEVNGRDAQLSRSALEPPLCRSIVVATRYGIERPEVLDAFVEEMRR